MSEADRYISQNALIKELAKIHGNLSTKNVGQAIWDTPTADVVEVVHARWSWETGEKRCINCCVKCPEDEYNYMHPNYCPNCGAKMDGESREG